MLGSPKQKSNVRPKATPVSLGRPTTFNWLDNLKIGQKLTLIAVGFLIPLVILGGFFINNLNSQIAFSAKERVGTRYLQPLIGLLEDVQNHRSLMAQWLDGNAEAQTGINQLRGKIQQDLQALKAIDQTDGAALQSTDLFNKLEQNLQPILQFNQQTPAASSWEAHTSLIKDGFNPLIAQVANTSNLILDPDLDSYWIMNTDILTLPQLVETVAQLRNVGTSSNIAKISPTQLANLVSLRNDMVRLLGDTNNQVGFVLATNPGLESTIGVGAKGVSSSIREMQQAIEAQIQGSQNISSKAFYDLSSNTLSRVFGFYHTTLTELDRLLALRVQKFQQTMWIELALSALALILTLLLVSYIASRITRPLRQLEDASSQLAQGNLQFALESTARDEIGQLTRSFQTASTQLKEFLDQQQEERERGQKLQANVSRFLNIATEIAQGDFTKRGEVTEDVLGNVVDAINLMTEEMAFLLKDVQKAALSVNQSAEQMNNLTDSIASGAQVQAEEVNQVRERTQQAAQAIRQMAERASGSVLQARQTLEAAQAGRSAVSATLSGMTDIRIEIQGIAMQVRALSKRSSEIETIAKTLEDFASQTNLLALNASFEAAGAGAVGRRFAVIADEIRSLAESSARETARVGSLVQEVQNDINGVVAMAQDGVRQVESGYRIANSAGERLEEISKLAEQAAQVAEQISVLAEGQVLEVEQVNVAVQSIAQTAVSTEQESLQGRQAAQDMRQLAENLTGNLSRFRLPN